MPAQSTDTKSDLIRGIESWLGEINPHYNDPFFPPRDNPYRINCGSCAFAVYQKLEGNSAAAATEVNIPTDEAMEGWTGKQCVYMSPEKIEEILKTRGAGAHLIVGVNRRRPSGQPISGHWFNAVYDGHKIYTVDGQSGEVMDWPHDYGYVSEWCTLL